MKISVVTISFNQHEYLRDALDSVWNQRGDFAVEHIVVDPGSTDGSLDEISSFSERNPIKSIIGLDSGPANALNLGLDSATGDIFYYLNADDIVLPGAFDYVTTQFQQHCDWDVICGAGYIIDREAQRVRAVIADQFDVRKYALGAAVALQQSTFFRASVLEGVRFNEENHTSWDGEFLVDVCLKGGRLSCPNVSLSCFRVYEESISGSGRFNAQHQKDHLRLFEKIYNRPFGKRDQTHSYVLRAVKRLRHAHKPADLNSEPANGQ